MVRWYHMCGIVWGGYSCWPQLWHQHCTDEAQKAETVLSAVIYIYRYILALSSSSIYSVFYNQKIYFILTVLINISVIGKHVFLGFSACSLQKHISMVKIYVWSMMWFKIDFGFKNSSQFHLFASDSFPWSGTQAVKIKIKLIGTFSSQKQI